MGAPRRYDHDEARQLRKQGWSYAAIGRRYNVSPSGVACVVDPEARRKQRAYHKEWQGRHNTCDDCGAPISFTNRKSRGPAKRCKPCSLLHAPTVRNTELRCYRCKEWFPDDGFFRSRDTTISPLRRGRARICKKCSVTLRKQRRYQHMQPCVDCGVPTMGKTGCCLTCANRRKGNGRQKRSA